MGLEIDLLENYPKTNRNSKLRASTKTESDKTIAKEFGKNYFDGDRRFGYGGYYYNEKFWKIVVQDFIRYYKLTEQSSILDIGSGKGFMIYEFKKALPKIKVSGLDISDYAIEHSKNDIREFQIQGNANNLPFENNSFDLVISITTLHNLNRINCIKAIKEIERVKKKFSFITVDAYSNEIEKEMMKEWNLTAETVMHTEDWKKFFKDSGYTGDFYWFKP